MISKEEIIRRIDRVAALSPVMTRILEKMNQPGLKMTELESLIRMEPALILNILKECNTPIWGRIRKVSSLKEAIVYLGLNKVKTIIMYSCFLPYINMPYPGYEDRNGELWRHSMGVSILADEIAKRYPGLDSNTLFLSSVFHDIGKMVLSQYVLQYGNSIRDKVFGQKISFVLAEREVFSIDHAEIGAMLLEKWNMADDVIRVVRYHHQVQAVEPDQLLYVVSLANEIADSIGYAPFYGSGGSSQLDFLCEKMELTERELQTWIARFTDRIRQLENDLLTENASISGSD